MVATSGATMMLGGDGCGFGEETAAGHLPGETNRADVDSPRSGSTTKPLRAAQYSFCQYSGRMAASSIATRVASASSLLRFASSNSAAACLSNASKAGLEYRARFSDPVPAALS